MTRAYTEDQLVEQPAIGLFAELGWAVAGPPPTAGVACEPCDARLLGRETKGEVLLLPRLRAANYFFWPLFAYANQPIESESQTQPRQYGWR